ncbi:acyltransferase family protein [Atopobiaceae bacterium 24-176]
MSRGGGRLYWLDWVRAAGAVAVVLLHSMAFAIGTFLPSVDPTPSENAYVVIQMVLTRWAVPIFFMTSGALLLDPERAMGERKLLHYVLRVVCVLVLVNLVLVGNGAPKLGAGNQVVAWLKAVVYGKGWYHLWYLYALLGLYLLTPVLRAWVKEADVRWQALMLGVLFALAFVAPTLNSMFGMQLRNLVWLNYCVFYYLLGWFLRMFVDLNRWWLLAGLAGVVLCGLGQWFRLAEAGSPALANAYVGPYNNPDSCFLALYVAMLFLLAKRYLSRPLPGVVGSLAACSFGIYCFHPLVQQLLLAPGSQMPAWTPSRSLFVVLLFVCGLLGAWALTALVRKVPGLRRLWG